jgi:molybdate transport system substrate-binding protein
MPSAMLRGAFAALVLALAPLSARAAVVFAAASLSDVLTQAGKAYAAKGGAAPTFSFAASSALARQIEATGGADLFLSADRDWMDYLDGKGLIAHATRRDLLGNHLVLIAPAGASVFVRIAPQFDLKNALGGGRLALADPGTVPAGRYAKAALMLLGAWRGVAEQLAPAENVRVALAYVARGEAALGIVYRTDALAEPKVRVVGTFPDGSHAPIVYPAALTRDAKADAKAFLEFLEGAEAAAIFRKAGFEVLN